MYLLGPALYKGGGYGHLIPQCQVTYWKEMCQNKSHSCEKFYSNPSPHVRLLRKKPKSIMVNPTLFLKLLIITCIFSINLYVNKPDFCWSFQISKVFWYDVIESLSLLYGTPKLVRCMTRQWEVQNKCNLPRKRTWCGHEIPYMEHTLKQ